MLEQIIVLGQVPGTNISISFAAYSIAIIIAGITALAYIHREDIDRKRKAQKDRIIHIDRISI